MFHINSLSASLADRHIHAHSCAMRANLHNSPNKISTIDNAHLHYLILWNQVDILQKHFKKDHVHMRLWTRFYGMLNREPKSASRCFTLTNTVEPRYKEVGYNKTLL